MVVNKEARRKMQKRSEHERDANADVPLVVRRARLDTRRSEDSVFGSLGFAVDGG